MFLALKSILSCIYVIGKYFNCEFVPIKKILYYILSSIINSIFQTLFIAEIHVGGSDFMYNLLVSITVYNPMYGRIVMYIFFLNSPLGHFYTIALTNTEAMNILEMLN